MRPTLGPCRRGDEPQRGSARRDQSDTYVSSQVRQTRPRQTQAAADEAAVDEAAVDEAAVDEAAVDEAAADEACVTLTRTWISNSPQKYSLQAHL